jgi:hypothetical protein
MPIVRGKVKLPLCHEDIWGNGGRAPRVLNFSTQLLSPEPRLRHNEENNLLPVPGTERNSSAVQPFTLSVID